MQKVDSWPELENSLARIDKLKKNVNNQTKKVETKFGLPDVSRTIGEVGLSGYENTYGKIKEERDNNKEYYQQNRE